MAKFNLGKFTDKAKELVDKNSDKIVSSVDKVTDKVDQKTKGKYHDKLQKVDGLTAKLDKKGAAAAEGEAVEGAVAGEATPTDAAAPPPAPTTPPPAPSTTEAAAPPSFPEPS
jgi:hypothetical protein